MELEFDESMGFPERKALVKKALQSMPRAEYAKAQGMPFMAGIHGYSVKRL